MLPSITRLFGFDGPCTVWKGCIRKDSGYGQAYYKGKHVRAHRMAWEEAHGPIPEGMQVLHKCDNKPCVNVDHLFLGTHDDNMKDKVAKGRQAQGENTSPYLRPETVRKGSAHHKALLTEEDVLNIRATDARLVDLAGAYGVSISTISNIKVRKTWRHV